MANKEIIVLDTKDALAQKGADLFVSLATESIKQRGQFVVALAGGSTSLHMYALLAQESRLSNIDWSKIHIFWSDERFVSPDKEESAFYSIYSILLKNIPIPDINIHPYPTVGTTPEEAVKQYTSDLQSFFKNKPPIFDLIFLGIGPDGHTASLFPRLYKPKETEDLILIVKDSPKPPPVRLSFSLRLINNSRNIVVLAAGQDKAPVIQEILENPKSRETLPGAMIQPVNGNLIWLLDAEAASLLKKA